MREWRGVSLFVSAAVFLVKSFNFIDVFGWSADESASLMNVGDFNIENIFFSSDCSATSFFNDKCHWETLVENSKLAVGWLKRK